MDLSRLSHLFARDVVPFTPFDGYLKYIRIDKLDPLQRAAAELAFGEFFAGPSVPERAEFKHRDDVELVPTRPYHPRRFSGDTTLPRARYFTLCGPEGEDPGQTLLSELKFYNDPYMSGICLVVDGTDREATKWIQNQWPHLPLSVGKLIHVVFIHSAEVPSCAVLDLKRLGLIAEAQTTAISIPYSVERRAWERVIDLRRPRAQDWLCRNLKFGVTFARFSYDGYLSDGLVLHGPRPNMERTGDGWSFRAVQEPDYHREGHLTKLYPAANDWAGQIVDLEDTFAGLLALLVGLGRGGSPITEIVGRFLRDIEAQALIYPSARTDFGCRIEANEPVDDFGWSIVDYSNAPTAHPLDLVVEDPDSWSCPVNIQGDLDAAWTTAGRRELNETIYSARMKSGLALERAAMLLGYPEAASTVQGRRGYWPRDDEEF